MSENNYRGCSIIVDVQTSCTQMITISSNYRDNRKASHIIIGVESTCIMDNGALEENH